MPGGEWGGNSHGTSPIQRVELIFFFFPMSLHASYDKTHLFGD